MAAPGERRVLLDTDVWSLLFVVGGRRDRRSAQWRSALVGVTVAVSFQTRAEVLVGILAANWAEDRRDQVRSQLDATATIPLDESVIQSYAALEAKCRSEGHGLQAKEHTADRWIAATAIAHDMPLLSGDAVFRNAPLLRLLDEHD